MKKVIILMLVIGIALSINCVLQTKHTIEAHITLDIRHVQEQAGSLLDYVEKKRDELPVKEDNGEQKKTSWLGSSFCIFKPAYAESLATVSPLAKEIADRMRERYDAIEALKNQGCVAENNRGYLELKDCDAQKEAERKNEIQRLLSEENKDRKALYKEIANLNKNIPEMSISKVETIYALERIQRAKSGQIIQLPDNNEDFMKVKNSGLGQKLGDKCVPGAWVTVP
ncbi:MAG TPA: DUF1318 domain-containing protein [Candidatus Hydrogenedens sp.]|nr:DUF1318 domain-containing protein [Candidatus Hydrogenedens sp.]HPP59420.1 DUF1318 domain-containing protein [Candidatus Hydrogenedens sp.]